MANITPQEAYRNVIESIKIYAEAVAQRERERKSPLAREEARLIEQRLAPLLRLEPQNLADLAVELGVPRTLVVRSARRLVRTGAAAFAERKTAIRLRKRRAGVPSEDEAPESGRRTPEQIAAIEAWLPKIKAAAGQTLDETAPSDDDAAFWGAFELLQARDEITLEEGRIVVKEAS